MVDFTVRLGYHFCSASGSTKVGVLLEDGAIVFLIVSTVRAR